MRLNYFLLIILFSVSSNCNSQKQNNIWIFGDSCGINFSNVFNPMAFISNSLNGAENFNSICDFEGNLLFYINEPNFNGPDLEFYSKIYNSNFVMMENGDNIKTDFSETQGSIIIPFPDNNFKFYLFHIRLDPSYATDSRSLYYSVIDMSENSGLGKVISKNNLLSAGRMQEKITAVKHGNGKDWWLATHYSNSDEFCFYNISTIGISSPKVQKIGPFTSNWDVSGFCVNMGQMKFTEQGDRLGYVTLNKFTALFDFNRCTGVLTNYINLGFTNYTFNCIGYYGCSFSPSGDRFYCSTLNELYQYDLKSSDIIGSKTLLLVDTNDESEIGQHQIGPDNKIYISSGFGHPVLFTGPENLNLTVINSPNELYPDCAIEPYSFDLLGGISSGGLPNLPNYNL
jgi:hypothetical protein